MNLGVHQVSVLSPFHSIMVFEELSQELRTGCPWELLYADDFVIIRHDPLLLIGRISPLISDLLFFILLLTLIINLILYSQFMIFL